MFTFARKQLTIKKSIFLVDECASSPCKNGASCETTNDAEVGYSCQPCPEGWQGQNCDEGTFYQIFSIFIGSTETGYQFIYLLYLIWSQECVLKGSLAAKNGRD